ncbi:MAG TPA: ABC transporter permease [Vicinamibacterales bacterium]|nr:ABC transporter permease [Vicinamibacterales bacterium]
MAGSRLSSDVAEMISEQVEYRELLYQMTVRDLIVRYKQSVMGFGWAVFMPIVNTALFSVIFTQVTTLKTDVPYPLFAYAGLMFWNFFASSLRFCVGSLTSNATLVTKIYFPREILPFSSILVCIVDLGVSATILIGMMVYFGFPPKATLAFVPVILIVQVVFTAGIGLIISMANLFLRDVKYLFEVVLTVWMFATSVVYPIDNLGGKLGMVLKLNPMTPIIDGYRATILRGELPRPLPFALATIVAFVTLGVGWLMFHRAEFRFAESA